MHACQVVSVMPNSLQPYRLEPAWLSHPWTFPGKNTGVGRHVLLQGIFPTQGSNPHLTSSALAGGFFTASVAWEAPEEVWGSINPGCRHRPHALLLRIFPPSSYNSCLPGTFTHILFTLQKHQPCDARRSGVPLILHVKKSRSPSELLPAGP